MSTADNNKMNEETADNGHIFSPLEMYLIIPAIAVIHRELSKFTTKEEVNQFVSNKFFIIEDGNYYSVLISRYENMVIYVLANTDNKCDVTIVLHNTENQGQNGIQFIPLNQELASDLYAMYIEKMIDIYNKFNIEQEKQ